MSNINKKEQDYALLVSSVVHDLKTPLMAIRSSLNCTKDVFPVLIKSYELAISNKLMSKELDISFLKKISSSIDNALKETELTNYCIDKLRDTIKGNTVSINRVDRVVLYDVIKKSIDFHVLNIKNCDKMFIIDKKLKEITFLTERKMIEKSFIYFIDNLIRVSMANKYPLIQIKILGGEKRIVCSFSINNIDSRMIPNNSLFTEVSMIGDSKIGQGMCYFKDFIKKSEWEISELITNSMLKIDLVLSNSEGDFNGC